MSLSVSTQDGNTPHRAAVIQPGRVFYGDGSTAELRPGVAGDLPTILAGTLGRFTDQACVIVDGVDLAELQAGAGRCDGWNHTQLGPWTTFHRRDGRVVMIGVRAAMTRNHLGTLFTAETEPGVLAILLDRYHDVTGVAWRGTPAMSALSLMRLTWPNARFQPLWHSVEKGAGHAGPLIWRRELNEWESQWDRVRTFDGNSAYLGSAGNAELSWGALAHTGPRAFDPRIPGYWLIQPGNVVHLLDNEAGRPPLLPRLGRHNTVCVTTPYAKLLADLGDPVKVLDSWTGERGARILRKWAEQLRDARAAVEGWPSGGLRSSVLTAVKRTYTDATGAIQRIRKSDGGGMLVQRPDWAHTIIDLWRATLYRKMVAVRAAEGVWPVAVNRDAISYADAGDPENLARAVGVRRGLGGWKEEGAATVPEWVAGHPVRHAAGRTPVGAGVAP